jgi:hypothetical protein
VGYSAKVRDPTPQLMENLPKANTEEAKRWRYFEGFRRDLVVQLFLQKGAFWEAIREARSRNGIEAITSVPPTDFNSYVQQHPHDVYAILERVIPRGLRDTFTIDWQGFIQACLLYDPPETKLTEFDRLWAEPLPQFLVPRGGSKRLQKVAAPPIKELRDPADVQRHLTAFYEGLIEALIEQYLVPLGLTREQVLEGAAAQRPELWEKLAQGERRNTRRPYIVVDEFTTLEDVRWAFSKITNAEGKRPLTGRPTRSSLVAVECAILHDRYRWTYAELAERHGWNSDPNLASKYIKRGRETLSEAGQK